MTVSPLQAIPQRSRRGGLMAGVQHLGRSLMLPIAVLPVAAILLRLGQGDLLDIAFVAQAGAAIFANLGMLFAVGVAVGFARSNHGAAGLAGVVCYLVAFNGAEVLLSVPANVLSELSEDARALAEAAYREKEIGKLNVPIGIAAGLISGLLYNRFHTIRLPEFLAFFGGRRFVPIASGFAGLALAVIFGLGFPVIGSGLDTASAGIAEAGGAGLFVYGVLNRLLIVTGLHHILNNVAWFIVGDFNGATGDLNRFFAGDPDAGAFMAGFFPVMMFGLPAACLAMYRSAAASRRREVGGMYVSLGLTSFLTGVTEPIEFTFMFLAPMLYAIHAFLTGVAMAVMDVLGVKLGFGFSAGMFDYVLNYGLATRPLLLLPVGLLYGVLYYVIFRVFIVRFDMKVPGRGEVAPGQGMARLDRRVGTGKTGTGTGTGRTGTGRTGKGADWVAALGGAGNIGSIEACTTRLRLVLADNGSVDEAAMTALGARGFIRPSADTLQVVVGPTADTLCDTVRAAWARQAEAGPAEEAVQSGEASPQPGPAFDENVLTALLSALGGIGNINTVDAVPGRIRLRLHDAARVDGMSLEGAGARGLATFGESVHLVLGKGARDAARQIEARMSAPA